MTKTKNIAGLIPKHSSASGKIPTASQLEIGEIALNNNVSDPFLSTKMSDGSVARLDAAKQITITPNSSVIDVAEHWWTTAYKIGKLVVVNASFGLLTADAPQDTVLATGLPAPLGYDASGVVGDTFNVYHSPAIRVLPNGNLVVREGYTLNGGHYYAGTFCYAAQ